MSVLLGNLVVNETSGNGIALKRPVRLTTTTNTSINVDFRSGSNIDDMSLQPGDRVLIKDQDNAKENGIYVINASGSPTRADDCLDDVTIAGFMIYIEEGKIYHDSMWICTSEKPDDVVGTNDLIFKLLSDTKHPGCKKNPHCVDLEQARKLNNKLSGDIEFITGRIKGVDDPQDEKDVCNKQYVDNRKLHMLDPRTTVDVTYDDKGRITMLVYGNGEKKNIKYHNTRNTIHSIIYTTSTSVVTKFLHYDINWRVISMSVSYLEM